MKKPLTWCCKCGKRISGKYAIPSTFMFVTKYFCKKCFEEIEKETKYDPTHYWFK